MGEVRPFAFLPFVVLNPVSCFLGDISVRLEIGSSHKAPLEKRSPSQ